VPKTYKKSKKSLELPERKKETEKEADVFEVMDLEDERQIRDAIFGKFIDTYVYKFTMETKQGPIDQYGISWAGIKEICKQANVMGKARYVATDIPPILEEHDTYWLAKVQCEDKVTGFKVWGVKKQSKRKRGGQIDEHAETIAVSKAQRNAFRHLIPETLILDFIKEYVEKKKGVKQITVQSKEVQKNTQSKQKVDVRDVYMKDIDKTVEKLAELMKIKPETIVNRTLNKDYSKDDISELTLDELKRFDRDLHVRVNTLLKMKKEVPKAEQLKQEFYNDTN